MTTEMSLGDRKGPRISRRGLLKAIGGAAGVGLIGGAEYGSYSLLSDSIHITRRNGDGTSLSVFHPGIQSEIDTATAQLDTEISRHGPSLLVGPRGAGHYSLDRHVEETVVAVQKELIRDRRIATVAFHGLSLGGRTILDAANELQRLGTFDAREARSTLTLVDAPVVMSDTAFDTASMLAEYHVGFASNTIQSGLRMLGYNYFDDDPESEPLGPDVDIDAWMAGQAAANDIPLSLLAGQARMLRDKKSLTAEDMRAQSSVVFLGSKLDQIVHHETTIPQWRAATESADVPFREFSIPGVPHCSPASFPAAYKIGLHKAYAQHKEVLLAT